MTDLYPTGCPITSKNDPAQSPTKSPTPTPTPRPTHRRHTSLLPLPSDISDGSPRRPLHRARSKSLLIATGWEDSQSPRAIKREGYVRSTAARIEQCFSDAKIAEATAKLGALEGLGNSKRDSGVFVHLDADTHSEATTCCDDGHVLDKDLDEKPASPVRKVEVADGFLYNPDWMVKETLKPVPTTPKSTTKAVGAAKQKKKYDGSEAKTPAGKNSDRVDRWMACSSENASKGNNFGIILVAICAFMVGMHSRP